jgi:hypothetical protein
MESKMSMKDNKPVEKTFEEKSASPEWGAWKFVSDMLDTPDGAYIFGTSKCYEQIHDFVVEQKKKAFEDGQNKCWESHSAIHRDAFKQAQKQERDEMIEWLQGKIWPAEFVQSGIFKEIYEYLKQKNNE